MLFRQYLDKEPVVAVSYLVWVSDEGNRSCSRPHRGP
jgi:hypothetical protein